MDVCTAPLSYSFPIVETRLYVGVAAGLVSILGYGYVVERLLTRGGTYQRSLSHAFLQGTVVVSLLLYGLSLAGLCRPAYGVAAAGCLLALAHVRAWREGWRTGLKSASAWWETTRREGRWWPQPSWLWALPIVYVSGTTLLFASGLVAAPAQYGDLTAIWGFHGKALTCECVRDARFMTEAFWTGTHPEYPLFLPFLQSFFFTLMDSFRDDLVASPQSVMFVACVGMLWRGFSGRAQHWLGRVTIALLFLTFVTLPEHIVILGLVELNTLVFVSAVTLAVLQGERRRLPIYLAGLAFSKREGMVAALVWLAVLGVYEVVVQARGLPRRQRWSALRPLVPSALVVWTLIALNLLQPSLHEQYERAIFSPDAWRHGVAVAADIWRRFVAIVIQREIFIWLAAAAPLCLAGACCLTSHPTRRRSVVVLPVIWTAAMVAVHASVYLVNPSGAALVDITAGRLLIQTMFPVGIVWLWISTEHWASLRRSETWVRVGAMLALVAVTAPWVDDHRRHYQLLQSLRVERRQSGRDGFTVLNPSVLGYDLPRHRAAELDAVLPPGPVAGALVGEKDYFTINYLLYPRRFYAADPQQVSGTLEWQNWTEVSEVPLANLRLQFVIEEWRVRPLAPK